MGSILRGADLCVCILREGFLRAMAKRKRQLFVAIVDDDAGVRVAVEDLLNSVGLRTRAFASAEEFLRSAHGAAAGCLVLDFRLPGMNGLELQRELRARGRAVPVIFATAEANISPMVAAGALAVLRKPFNPEELSRLVKSVLEAPPRPRS
jgi:FixJ family two-component response regulator